MIAVAVLLATYVGSYAWIAQQRSTDIPEYFEEMMHSASANSTGKETEAPYADLPQQWFPFSKEAVCFYWPLCWLDLKINKRVAVSDPVAQEYLKTPPDKIMQLEAMVLLMGAMAEENAELAGTWEDDPENWKRAFGEDTPGAVTVIHSKYWKSDHWTDEYIYYFVVEATPQWRDEFLNEQGVEPVKAAEAWNYRDSTHCDLTPDWFVPGKADGYDVYAQPGSHGNLWIDKKTGYIHFWNSQL